MAEALSAAQLAAMSGKVARPLLQVEGQSAVYDSTGNISPISSENINRMGGTFGVVGDSRASSNLWQDNGTEIYGTLLRGIWAWVNYMLGGIWTFRQGMNWAEQGTTSSYWITNLLPNVVAAAPLDWMVVYFPTNDAANNISSATSISNLTTILNTLLARGTKVILFCGGIRWDTTKAQYQNVREVNAWMKAQGRRLNVYVVDSAVINADMSTGLFAEQTPSLYADTAGQGTHESPTGAVRIAWWIAQQLWHAAAAEQCSMWWPAPWDTAARNPTMAGSSGSGNAIVTPGWGAYLAASGRRSKLARDDKRAGEWCQLVWTPSADGEEGGWSQSISLTGAWSAGMSATTVTRIVAGGNHYICTTPGTAGGTEPTWSTTPGTTTTDGTITWTRIGNITRGNRYTMRAELSVTSTGLCAPRLYLQITGGTQAGYAGKAFVPLAGEVLPPSIDRLPGIPLVLSTPPITIPADATGVTLMCVGRGNAGDTVTVRMGNVYVEEV